MAGWLAVGARSATAQDLEITAVCTPAPSNCSGWYRQDVTVDWVLNPRPDEGTQIISCPDPRTLTVDTAGQPVWCEARYGADSLRRTKTMRLDKTAPTVIGASPSRGADANGWYRNPVRVDFHGSDATSGILSCSSVTYAQADSAQATVSGTCQDVAGNMSAASPFALRYDATAPDITGARRSRPPDHDGWYNRPVRWSFQATDSVSGLAECPPVVYDGAPGPASPLTGRCRDRAGNVATRVFPIPYDATPPALVLKARPGDRTVRVRIRVGADVRRIVVRRAPGRRGTELVHALPWPAQAIHRPARAQRPAVSLHRHRHRPGGQPGQAPGGRRARAARPRSRTRRIADRAANAQVDACARCAVLQRPASPRQPQGALRMADEVATPTPAAVAIRRARAAAGAGALHVAGLAGVRVAGSRKLRSPDRPQELHDQVTRLVAVGAGEPSLATHGSTFDGQSETTDGPRTSSRFRTSKVLRTIRLP